MNNEASILVEVERNGIVESHHRGWIAVCDINGNLINGTHNKFPDIFARSAIKPFQAMPFLFSKAMNKYGFDIKDLAIVCSSHSGEKIHTDLVKNILNKIGLDESYLKCGTHIPYGVNIAGELLKNNQKPTPIHCNCSGKHSGMLVACLINNWDLENYCEYSHPLQQSIRNHISELMDIDGDKLKYGIDGCNIPTYYIPLEKLSVVAGKIVNSDSDNSIYGNYLKLIKKAFLSNPELIAGKNRVDTQLMEAFPGKIISKIGGEAVMSFALIEEKISVAVKIEDGINRPMLPVIIDTIEKLGFKTEKYSEAKKLKFTALYNNLNKKIGIVNPVVKLLN